MKSKGRPEAARWPALRCSSLLGEPGKVCLVHRCALTHRFCLRISRRYAWYIGMDGCILQIEGTRQSMEEVCPVNRYPRLRQIQESACPGSTMSSSSVARFPQESWVGRFGKVHVGAAGNTEDPRQSMSSYVRLIGSRQTVAAAAGPCPEDCLQIST